MFKDGIQDSEQLSHTGGDDVPQKNGWKINVELRLRGEGIPMTEPFYIECCSVGGTKNNKPETSFCEGNVG